MNAAFFGLWVPKILAAARSVGVRDFPIFGEVTLTDDIELSAFVRDRGLPTVLDFPFQDAAAGYAAGQTSARALGSRLADDDYFRGPSGAAPTPPTFLGNHDMGRAAQQIIQHGAADDEKLLSRVLLGYDLLYLLRGAPVVYYGDEVGMIGRGGDQAARQDMFPTKVAEWRTQPRVGSPPVGSGSSFDVTNPIQAQLKALAELRTVHPALATGSTLVRVAQQRLLVVSRFDQTARREYVVAFNAGDAPVAVSALTSTPSSVWTRILGGAGTVSSDAAGKVALSVPGRSAVVFRSNVELPARTLPRPVVRVGTDPLTGTLKQVTTAIKTADPASVTFAQRRGGGGWHRLASDDSPPYRAFVEPGRYRKGEHVDFVAVARSSAGRVSVSSIATVRVR